MKHQKLRIRWGAAMTHFFGPAVLLTMSAIYYAFAYSTDHDNMSLLFACLSVVAALWQWHKGLMRLENFKAYVATQMFLARLREAFMEMEDEASAEAEHAE